MVPFSERGLVDTPSPLPCRRPRTMSCQDSGARGCPAVGRRCGGKLLSASKELQKDEHTACSHAHGVASVLAGENRQSRNDWHHSVVCHSGDDISPAMGSWS